MIRSLALSLVFLLATLARAQALPEARRIVFLGDSITHGGAYVEHVAAALIAQHPDRQIEIIGIGLSSETVSGLSEPGHAGGKFPRPDLHERLDRVLEKARPDLVLACYGMNCGIYHPLSDERFQKYKDGIIRLREKCAAAGAKMVHLTPPVFDPLPIKDRLLPAGLEVYEKPFEGYGKVLDAYSDWLVSKRADGWEVIDIHGPMNAAIAEARKTDPAFTLSRDGVHPGEEGHKLMALQIMKAWGLRGTPDDIPAAVLQPVREKQRILKDAWLTHTGHKRPGVKPGLPLEEATAKAKELDAKARAAAKGPPGTTDKPARDGAATEPVAPPFPGARSAWNGFDKYDFDLNGRKALVVVPKQAAPGRPWVWHGEFFGHKPAPDIALLGRGFHIAYLGVPNMLGCPEAVRLWDGFYHELTSKHGLSKKPALVGLSRGGLYCYNWAIANPGKVSCIYGDAPVCDFKSWPGGKGKGKGDKTNWGLVLKLWGFKSEEEAMQAKVNPVDRLEPLAKAGVPLLHVFGDADDVVPWDENTGIIAARYEKLGGSIKLIRKPGIGHHPHGLDDSTPIVDFIASHAVEAR